MSDSQDEKLSARYTHQGLCLGDIIPLPARLSDGGNERATTRA